MLSATCCSLPHNCSGLLCGFEDVRLHPEIQRSFHVVGPVVEEESAARLAAQCVEAMAVDGWIRFYYAKFARPDLDLEFVEPFEFAANVGQQVVRHVGQDGGPHPMCFDFARQRKRMGCGPPSCPTC